MTLAEMKTILKMRGWRLRSKVCWPNTKKRRWYVTDEHGYIAVMSRDTPGRALQWAIALITEDAVLMYTLRLLEGETK